MRAIQVTRPGGPEVLEVVDEPEPEPGPGQVTVQTTVIGVNFTDLFARMLPSEGPVIPGVEAVGIVVAVGDGVTDLRPGQRVIAAPLYQLGAYAEQIVVDATHVFAIPDGVSDEQAAAITLNYGTAHAALHLAGRVQPGETVLIHAAAGGVGTAAIQLARLVGGVHIVGTASGQKRDYLLAQGADQVIDYRTADWVDEVRRTHPDGVDIVLDSVGESGFARSIAVLRYGGRVVGFGLSAAMRDDGAEPDIEGALSQSLSLSPFVNNATGFIGCHLGAPAPMLRTWVQRLIDLCERGSITPHIDRVFPLAGAADAHRYLHSRRSVGKVLLRV